MENNKKVDSLNVARNTIGKYFISTAMWATGIAATGMRHPTYETFVWEWDAASQKRGKLLKQYYFERRGAAINFHFRFCRTLSYRKLKEEMSNDNPYVERDNLFETLASAFNPTSTPQP